MRSEDVRQARFNALRFDGCYDEQEVDQFLAQAAIALEGHEIGDDEAAGAVRSADIKAVKFTSRVYERGYSAQEVDDFLDQLGRALEHHEGGE